MFAGPGKPARQERLPVIGRPVRIDPPAQLAAGPFHRQQFEIKAEGGHVGQHRGDAGPMGVDQVAIDRFSVLVVAGEPARPMPVSEPLTARLPFLAADGARQSGRRRPQRQIHRFRGGVPGQMAAPFSKDCAEVEALPGGGLEAGRQHPVDLAAGRRRIGMKADVEGVIVTAQHRAPEGHQLPGQVGQFRRADYPAVTVHEQQAHQAPVLADESGVVLDGGEAGVAFDVQAEPFDEQGRDFGAQARHDGKVSGGR